MCAFRGLWVFSCETQGRGSHAIFAGLQICSSWPRVPGIMSIAFIPDPQHLLSDPTWPPDAWEPSLFLLGPL